MKAKSQEQEEAIRLRQEGMAYNTIATKLGVSKASVHNWIKGASLDAGKEKELRHRLHKQASAVRGQAYSKNALAKRSAWQAEGREQAKAANALHIQGCMLYWAEGSKSRNQVAFANSDVEMAKVFLRFLIECYGIDKSAIRLSINCYTTSGLTQKQIEDHWLNQLGLSTDNLGKTIVNYFPSENHGTKIGKLPYGVGRIVVNNTRLVQNIYGAIQEYCGFENPSWIV